jgi:hypothetical protein
MRRGIMDRDMRGVWWLIMGGVEMRGGFRREGVLGVGSSTDVDDVDFQHFGQKFLMFWID